MTPDDRRLGQRPDEQPDTAGRGARWWLGGLTERQRGTDYSCRQALERQVGGGGRVGAVALARRRATRPLRR